MKRALLTVLGIAAFAGLAIFLQPPSTVSAEGNNNTQASQTSNNTTKAEAGAYQYTAKAGDSYSVLARKAIQTYGIETKTNLGGGQIIFAETNLTQAASSPLLNEGQAVSISKSTVKSWVEQAQKLTAAQQAAWDYYIPFVDFNTNNNG